MRLRSGWSTRVAAACATLLSASILTAVAEGGGGPYVEAAHPQAHRGTDRPAHDPSVVAAGDISPAAKGAQVGTSNLVRWLNPTRVLTLGDNQYPRGSLADFRRYYAATWGRFKARTRPTPGDHDYGTPNAGGYFAYFGALARPNGRSFYSFNLGGWHIVSLNSNTDHSATSPQGRWLHQNLAATRQRCVLAYWHSPRFTSGGHHGNDYSVSAFWAALYNRRADIVLNGDSHNYERFAQQTPARTASRTGIREFVVGTGGVGTYPFRGVLQPHSQKRIAGVYGVLRLILHPKSYEWRFVTPSRRVLDRGGPVHCH